MTAGLLGEILPLGSPQIFLRAADVSDAKSGVMKSARVSRSSTVNDKDLTQRLGQFSSDHLHDHSVLLARREDFEAGVCTEELLVDSFGELHPIIIANLIHVLARENDLWSGGSDDLKTTRELGGVSNDSSWPMEGSRVTCCSPLAMMLGASLAHCFLACSIFDQVTFLESIPAVGKPGYSFGRMLRKKATHGAVATRSNRNPEAAPWSSRFVIMFGEFSRLLSCAGLIVSFTAKEEGRTCWL